MVTSRFWGMSETDFLRAYAATALRKPQVVSDNVLTGVFLADASHRLALTALLLQEAVEAARRLAGVWEALTDRRQPVSHRLSSPLPRADAWHSFVEAAAAARDRPELLLQAMAIDSSALQSAVELAAYDGLANFEAPLRVFEAGPPIVLLDPSGLLAVGADTGGERVEARWALADDPIVALGDATGYFVTWARDFLEAYIDARDVAASGRR
jgi:hypothetical protein